MRRAAQLPIVKNVAGVVVREKRSREQQTRHIARGDDPAD